MDRILVTHSGSLIRPAALDTDLLAKERGDSIDEERFEQNLRTGVSEVIRMQVGAGLDIINDGEYDKNMWITYIYGRLNGVEPRVIPFDTDRVLDNLPETLDREKVGYENLHTEINRFVPFWTRDWRTSGDAVGWVANGPISYDSSAIDRHLTYLKQALDGVEYQDAFVTAVSPASMSWIVNEHYDTNEDFVFALAAAAHEEYRRIIEAGFMLQVDDAVMWRQHATITMSGGSASDYARWADLQVEALNRALSGLPRHRIRYHICAGSGVQGHLFDPPLREVLPFVLRVNWGWLLFEQANVSKEHEWTVWREFELDEDRILVPGVITHHTYVVENPELVAQRLVRLANLVGRERIVAGADCGFAQSAAVPRTAEWTQWQKLNALVAGARLASERLWGSKVSVL